MDDNIKQYQNIASSLATKLNNSKTFDQVVEVLEAYAKLDKTFVMASSVTLLSSLESIVGGPESLIIWQTITTGADQINDAVLSLCSTEETKAILSRLNSRFHTSFLGCNIAIPDDWVRVFWINSVDIRTNKPLNTISIFKRNGEVCKITSTDIGFLALADSMLQQLALTMESGKLNLDDNGNTELTKIKSTIERLNKFSKK